MQAKSDSAMSISEGKAKGVPMTPTAQIAAIRQRAERAYPRGVSDIRHDGTPVYTQMGDPVADVRFLLAAWDTHQSALRALVAQWKNKAESHRRAAHAYTGFADDNGVRIAQMHRTLADCIDAQAHELERLLESEQ